MAMLDTDIGGATIFALSSGTGRAGVAVIRVAGPSAGAVVDRMASPRPKPRYAAFRRVRHPETGEVLDEALVIWLPGPGTETGEDMAELQIHGGAAVIRAVLQGLSCIAGCRMAEPGEFVRRAFHNGRLDLTAVEGLGDLIDAETEAQRRQALAQAQGGLAKLYERWRERLLIARGLAEAAIDFSDEDDVAEDAMVRARGEAKALLAEIDGHLNDGHRGEIVRDGFSVVLAGPPNVGKSSVLNALARRDVAIVSPEAGTTRDVLEVRLDLGGYAVVLADTAGLREAEGLVEQEGIRRTLGRVRDADLVLWLVDATNPVWERPADFDAAAERVLIVVNKVDLSGPGTGEHVPGGVITVSAVTGLGIAGLIERLRGEVAERLEATSAGQLVPTQERQRVAIEEGAEALRRFLGGGGLVGESLGVELQAEELRLAADALGRVVGRFGVEDVLGEIFGRFCIGK